MSAQKRMVEICHHRAILAHRAQRRYIEYSEYFGLL